MNTTPTTIQTAHTLEMAAGKPQGSATPDTPFSQVLSGEMANKRSAAKPAQEASNAAQEVRSNADAPADAAAADATAEAVPVEATTEVPAELVVDAQAPGLAVVPDAATLLGLAITPDGQPAGATPALDVEGDANAAAAGRGLALPFDTTARQGRTAPQQSGVPGEALTATLKAEPAQSGKGAPQAAAQAATAAAAFAGQLAAARQNDAMLKADGSFDPMLSPSLRAAGYAPQELAQLNTEAAQPRLAPAVGSAAWGQALGDKIVWMTAAAQQTATLTLNPPNMGPLQIVLNISNDQAVANFFSAQPEVRQALEAAFPRLKEMMNEAGIQLEQATVSADTPKQRDDAPDRQGQGAAHVQRGDDALSAQSVVITPARQMGRGLIDTFA